MCGGHISLLIQHSQQEPVSWRCARTVLVNAESGFLHIINYWLVQESRTYRFVVVVLCFHNAVNINDIYCIVET